MKSIYVIHKNGTAYVPENSELDDDGTLISFYIDGSLQFAVPREDFVSAELVERP